MAAFRRHAFWCAVALLAAGCAFVSYAAVRENRRGILTVAFLDVGQGDAIFIESPAGAQVLIDGGPDRSVVRALGRVMPFYDRSIDAVVATHPDLDHIGGLPTVFARYRVGAFLEPGLSADNGAYEALEGAVRAEGAQATFARRGVRLALGGGAVLEILLPDRPVGGFEPNSASVVVRLSYGATSFLLTGDAPAALERYLLSLEGAALDADVLKAGHHGSDTSSDPLFVGAVSPAYAVVSAGADNRYGHPHRSVLDTLTAAGARVLSTAERGTVVFKSDGTRVWAAKLPL